MPQCYFCKKPVFFGIVAHSECMAEFAQEDIPAAIDKLVEYQSTGFQPEELRELGDAKVEVRLFVEPKPGADVWLIWGNCDACGLGVGCNLECPPQVLGVQHETYDRSQHLQLILDGELFTTEEAATKALKEKTDG